MYCYNCFCSFGICVYYHILSLIINIHIFINLYKKYQIHSFVKYQAVLLFVNCFELFYVFTLKRKNRNILFVVSGCTVYFFLFCTCSLFHCCLSTEHITLHLDIIISLHLSLLETQIEERVYVFEKCVLKNAPLRVSAYCL